MKTIEEYLLDIIGYGNEASIVKFLRPHMIAVVAYKCSHGYLYEVVKFVDSDGIFISLDDDVTERSLDCFTVYSGLREDCINLLAHFESLPLIYPYSYKGGE